MHSAKLGILLLALALGACSSEQPLENPLQNILASDSPLIKKVMDSVERHELQIRYTQIDRKRDSVVFTDYDFQVDKDNYFYPASTVKFPIAVLALEKLQEIDSLHKDTKFYVEGDSVETTFAKAVSEIFAVSDNHANNRLVEFLGQDAINQRLDDKGIVPVRIAHRLGHLNDSTTGVFEGTINTSPLPLKINKIKKGTGYFDGDSLIKDPFDFALKNYYPIEAQHGVLKRIIFPEKFKATERFQLSEPQRDFLLEAMHTLPRKVGYDPVTYYDGYCKFFLYGDTKERIPEHIKIYNKVGFAYGTLTDCAYIVDTENQVEFMLTATLLVNKDGIFNDDAYEYDETGIPFLAELGRQLYEYELRRK